LLSFSQTDTDSLVCIPIEQARQAAIELKEYDYCQVERDSLKVNISEYQQIIEYKDSIIEIETSLKNEALVFIDSLGITISTLNTEVETLNEDNKSLKTERNILRGVIALLGTVFSIVL
jgi:hypothetical protein